MSLTSRGSLPLAFSFDTIKVIHLLIDIMEWAIRTVSIQVGSTVHEHCRYNMYLHFFHVLQVDKAVGVDTLLFPDTVPVVST